MSTDRLFTALGDPTRRAIVELLVEQGRGTATGLSAQLAISRQAVAKHLSQLSTAGLTSSRRVGRETHYVIDPRPLAEVSAWIADVERLWDSRLAGLKRTLDGD